MEFCWQMGISVSCPFSDSGDLEKGIESIIVRSISFGKDEAKTVARSISFNGRDSDPTIVKSLGSGKMIIEGSISFKRRELGTLISITAPSVDDEEKETVLSDSPKSEESDIQSPIPKTFSGISQELPPLDRSSPKHEAATKLQKVYKSFRTRRKLADCAVLVAQSWWKVLDSVELKRSSVSFFDIEKHETAISRWSRARTRAAKVGKGLLKNDKARKLALQHWLEAIDPRHRYGHNLHFYYDKWLHCQSKEPFFYWLDIGEGKEASLEKCPRSKLQQQCIKYLGPMERKAYEVAVVDGKFFYKQSGEILHTLGESEDTKWIFVLSTSKSLYVGKKRKGTFQHSSFLAGGATSAAGRLVVEHGTLKAVWPHSGHYRPTEENFRDFISFLEENNVDISNVKMSAMDDEEGLPSRQRSSVHIRSNSNEEDYVQKANNVETEEVRITGLTKEEPDARETASVALASHRLRKGDSLSRNLARLEISGKVDLLKSFSSEDNLSGETKVDHTQAEPSAAKKAITSQKSFQLGKQLSCKWTTGAGPRIGCVRNYPPEIQCRALEHVNLSPRSLEYPRSFFSPRTPSGLS
ncbi:IQ domain-containing protein IQM2-like [Punica granatum]|uniref:IQ domain-containing protein IQM2-like n=1 Tax=Punica granatum TaxID=22663 RepID=A0A6P8E283_PUNGR|nr:IQ domain-containing protein IQM2-like [Punica granatum]